MQLLFLVHGSIVSLILQIIGIFSAVGLDM